jgi:very-short-patch-repair endonuclease
MTRDPSAAERMRDAAIRKSESAFETEVLRRLANAGFAIESQYAVGAYRIDIVVGLHSGPRLAVECDGERFHTLENLREDTERQAILERLGWRFERIRGSRFYRDPEAAMATVFARLAQMGIRANLDDGAPVPQNAQGLVERVRARAQELIAELDERLANAQTGTRRSWRGVRRQHSQVQDRETVSE